MYRALILSLMVVACVPIRASAQRHVQYDTLAESTPAAVSCGFCGGEKFGVVFRQLSTGGGLLPSSFPLTVESVEVVLARVMLQDNGLFFECVGSSTEGSVDANIAIYAGETPPTGSILNHPVDGPWPGESLVWTDTVSVMVSVATAAGGSMYNVMFNTIPLPDGGIMVDLPNTYLRVVVTIPGGGVGEGSCTLISHPEPTAVPIRDEGRLENELNFIYAVDPGGLPGAPPEGWHWNESNQISDPNTGASTIQGDWGLRLNIIPASAPTPDGGTPLVDAGTPLVDAGIDAGPTPVMDSGVVPVMDSGTPAPECSADSECAGGERCVEGMCRRVSCSAAADCAGGMTCVEGMCRNLCTSSSECLGGEVCDTEAGHCVPVGTDDGGCGCRAVGASRDGAGIALALLALGAIVIRRRR